jgi:catechol 2,3-dioxygenase-like lactoylglutathione lyase family enzyme
MNETRLYCNELRTADWLRLVTWYRDIAGLRVVVRMTPERYALLAGGDGRLAILGRDEVGPASARWSLAFEVPALETVRNRLRHAGQEVPEPTPTAEGYHELVVRDPDGNRVRFFEWPG